MARRGYEVQSEPLEIVVRAGEAGDFELAAVTGAGVDLPDRERPAEESHDLRGQPLADALNLTDGSARFGDDARSDGSPELAKHVSAELGGALPDEAREAWSGCP